MKASLGEKDHNVKIKQTFLRKEIQEREQG